MGSFQDLVKTICIPALISLAIYVLIFYALIPFIRRYRERYSQYLPLHTISAHTSSFRERISDTVMRFVLRVSSRRPVEGQDGSDTTFDEEGEEMDGFEEIPPRHGILGRRAPEYTETGGRLSRELEQGFMDDSDDDAQPARQTQRQ